VTPPPPVLEGVRGQDVELGGEDKSMGDTGNRYSLLDAELSDSTGGV